MLLLSFLLLPSVAGVENQYHSNFESLTKHEFCSGSHHVRINPKHIPELLDYLTHCSTSSKEPNVDSFSRRQAVIHLFNAATPVIHKAFFDSKTALKYVVMFTKLKHEAVQYANYANKYGDHSLYSRKKLLTTEGSLTYAPESDEGSYNLNEDLRVCASILNRKQNTSVKDIIKPSQLPRVAKAARIITFPPFNLSLAVSSEDTPYMILDMYVLAMRCLSFTNLHTNTTAQVSDHIISTLKKKVMPFVPPHEFERAYLGMMTLAHSGPKGEPVAIPKTTTPVKRTAAKPTKPPTLLELNDKEGNASAAISNDKYGITSCSPCSSKKSFRQTFVAMLKSKFKSENASLLTDKVCRHDKSNTKAMMIISAILGVCGTLAVVLYCLLFGCCGWLTVARYDCDHDDVDDCIEGYGRFCYNMQESKCYCTLADSNQMDVIAALHQRCELLSKKICAVVQKISMENVIDNPESMDVLREFVRSISANMVNENETIYHFGKSMSCFIKPQSKISSVNRNTF